MKDRFPNICNEFKTAANTVAAQKESICTITEPSVNHVDSYGGRNTAFASTAAQNLRFERSGRNNGERPSSFMDLRSQTSGYLGLKPSERKTRMGLKANLTI